MSKLKWKWILKLKNIVESLDTSLLSSLFSIPCWLHNEQSYRIVQHFYLKWCCTEMYMAGLVLISVRWSGSHSWPWLSTADDRNSWKSTTGSADTVVFSNTDKVWKLCIGYCFISAKCVHWLRFHEFVLKSSSVNINNINNILTVLPLHTTLLNTDCMLCSAKHVIVIAEMQLWEIILRQQHYVLLLPPLLLFSVLPNHFSRANLDQVSKRTIGCCWNETVCRLDSHPVTQQTASKHPQ